MHVPLSPFLRVLLSTAVGCLSAFAFEPVAITWLLFPGLAAFFLLCRAVSIKLALAQGGGFGLGFWITLVWWMTAVGPDAMTALTLIMTGYTVLLAGALALVSRLPGWPLWLAVVWTGVETVRGAWPLGGFTWGRLGFASIDTPYQALLPWVGVTGLSFVFALTAAVLAALVVGLPGLLKGRQPPDPERPRPHVGRAVAGLGVLILPILAGYVVPHFGADQGSLQVAVVQGNVPGAGNDLLAVHREVTRNQVVTTQALADQIAAGSAPQPDFVVWPENSTAVDPFTDLGANSGISSAVSAIGVPILVGGMVNPPTEQAVLNQGIVWDPVTGGGDRYTKRHPVPFGEYIPYRNEFDISRTFGKLALVPSDMMAGTRSQPLTIAGTPVADVICFDVAYDDSIAEQVRAGGQLVVVQTSNAMFINTHQLDQQWAISRVRAIETGRYVVVAATNGITGIVAPDGSVVASVERRTTGLANARVGLSTTLTPGVVIGPWLGRVCALLGALAVLFCGVTYRFRVRRVRHDATQNPSLRTAAHEEVHQL